MNSLKNMIINHHQKETQYITLHNPNSIECLPLMVGFGGRMYATLLLLVITRSKRLFPTFKILKVGVWSKTYQQNAFHTGPHAFSVVTINEKT